MNTWSIVSGGRLENQITNNTSFSITQGAAFENVLLPTEFVKKSFEEKLRLKLPVSSSVGSTDVLSVSYQSTLVANKSGWPEVEFTVFVKDENDSMLWYFLLTSPEKHISPDNLDELVTHIVARLGVMKVTEKPMYWL